MSSSIYKILAFSFLVMAVSPAAAKDDKKKEKPDYPLYQGIQIGIGISEPAKALFSDSWGASVKADINLKNKYLPTIETGIAIYDKTSDLGTRFTSTGQYFKVGVNLPISFHGDKAEDILFAGLHYGMSAFSYKLEGLTYAGNYWGDSQTSVLDENAFAGWVGVDAGVRVKVAGPISLGWSFQYKSILHIKTGDNSNPPYIPGYGSYVKPNAGIVAHLYYRLPF